MLRVFRILGKVFRYFYQKKLLDEKSTILSLLKKIDILTKRLDQVEKENDILKQEVCFLKQENTTLKARINSNSKNSSKPPSSDGYKKKPALPKPKKGKQGGQKGHKGQTLKQIEIPDKIVKCIPDKCTCGCDLTKEKPVLSETRQVFDLPKPKLEVTEYQIYKTTCPNCRTFQKGAVPNNVNAPVQYGDNVKAYVVLLNVHFKLPFKKIQQLFNDLFGYSINESTVYAASKLCYDKLYKSEQVIKDRIIKENVAHADETGIRVNRKLNWLHTVTSNLHTYLFAHEKRGALALESDKSILNKLSGWLIHDCWSSYFKFEKLKHGLCGAHILRELQGLIENEKSEWPKKFKAFLLKTCQTPFNERVKQKKQIEAEYKQICENGEKLEPPPQKMANKRGRYKRTKGRNLVERLIKEQEAVLAFAFNKEVPFTNNLAERDIRPAKVKLKISNCFRTFSGAEIYARIEGFVSTARKNNQNVFTELCTTFEGYNFLTK